MSSSVATKAVRRQRETLRSFAAGVRQDSIRERGELGLPEKPRPNDYRAALDALKRSQLGTEKTIITHGGVKYEVDKSKDLRRRINRIQLVDAVFPPTYEEWRNAEFGKNLMKPDKFAALLNFLAQQAWLDNASRINYANDYSLHYFALRSIETLQDLYSLRQIANHSESLQEIYGSSIMGSGEFDYRSYTFFQYIPLGYDHPSPRRCELMVCVRIPGQQTPVLEIGHGVGTLDALVNGLSNAIDKKLIAGVYYDLADGLTTQQAIVVAPVTIGETTYQGIGKHYDMPYAYALAIVDALNKELSGDIAPIINPEDHQDRMKAVAEECYPSANVRL